METAAGIVIGAGASIFYSSAIALQAAEARRAPAEDALHLSLLRRLVHRRRWVLAIAIMAAGFALHTAALALAPLTVVQPVRAVGLILLAVVGARALGERVGPREAGAIAAIVAGVTLLAYTAPQGGHDHAGAMRLVPALGGLAILALLPYLLQRRAGSLVVVLGAAFAYSWADFATKLLADESSLGHWGAAIGWLAGTAAAGGLGVLSENSAFQRRPATQVAPIGFCVQVVVPVLLARFVGDERWDDTPLGLPGVTVGLAVVIAGAAVLAGSPAVTAAQRRDGP